VADVHREQQAPVGGLRYRQTGQHLPQPGHVDVPAVQRLVHRAVPRRCSAVSVRPTGVVTGPSAHSNRVGQLEQRVSARGQAVEEVVPEV
jgi:hypothetical protein